MENESVNAEAAPMVEVVAKPEFDCSYCKDLMPCKKESKSSDMTICEKFNNFYATEEGMSLVELQALNESIPEDPIEVDTAGIEADKLIPIAVGDSFVVDTPDGPRIGLVTGLVGEGATVEVAGSVPKYYSREALYS